MHMRWAFVAETADEGDKRVAKCVRLGEPAPNFVARSTLGTLRLDACRGSWVLLFSHPGDFTPVCTSEFLAFARAEPRFEELGAKLIGLSVDSLYSHFAWLRLIRDQFGVDIRFPIVEDPTLEIGRAYGMVSADAADASAVRSTYFIDPDGVVRAITSYPYNVGRSVDEMLRVLTALRATGESGQLAPEGWQPGDPLFDPPSADLDRVLAADEPADWFYRRKEGRR